MSEWQLYNRKGQEYFSIDSWLQDGVDIAFTTRRGGCGTGAFEACNLGLHVGDQAEKVLTNRRNVLRIFDAELGQAVCCQQVHGDIIQSVNKSQQGQGAFRHEQAIPNCDSLITNTPGVFLFTFYADCIPIFFFDPVHRAVGVAHSGWKGTMAQIAVKTLKAMEQEYNSRSGEVHIAIGPGIAGCCFQVASDLYDKVNQAFTGYNGIIKTTDSNEFYWDLPETNRQMLIKYGVKPHHITSSNLCTACHPELFFSYRRDNGDTGRMGALIALKH
ncbi:Multi-copper polyphenol oxidoreductase, laccase [Syntrophomonas zehnderi OL-4]|uniref:Purine nucleoside phosphorylase n=1 Tax=Syntrophomonas zehnderi OL-4 TaxID=690567 RepID=A0A0E3W377_9FIRM|nr:peptidoglycan editing factor PgeF [Syntrophomonas zehnderi]CFX57094.1 Multi-copper polyphenol oxidoreductase, laccase [Syntrophomonas zehnderi OL-4]